MGYIHCRQDSAQQVVTICNIAEDVATFRAKLLSVLDSTKKIQTAPLYFKQTTHNNRDLLLPMVDFAFVDNDNFGATFEISGTATNICLDVYVTGGVIDAMLSETIDEVAVYTATEKEKLAGVSDNASDNVIEEIQVNGTALVPDANKSVNIVMSGGGGGESNVIEIVKVNGTPLVPDANKAVDVITTNYITQDMTAAEILAVADRCVDENYAYVTPIYLYDDSVAFLPCAEFYYDNANNTLTMVFNNFSSRVARAFEIADGEVSETDGIINVAALNHNHTGVYQPMESGKGLSTNDLTNTLKANYDAAYTHSQAAHAPSGAQANVIESIKVNGNALTVSNKAVDIVEPQWRTVKTLTLAEAVNEIVITTDNNGNPFNLTSYIVKLEIPTAAVTGNAAVRASASAETESNTLYSSFSQGVNADSARYMACRGEKRGGLWRVDTVYPTATNGGGSNVQTALDSIGSAVSGVNAVSRFRINSSATTDFPVGTIITILGVDA